MSNPKLIRVLLTQEIMLSIERHGFAKFKITEDFDLLICLPQDVYLISEVLPLTKEVKKMDS